MSDTTQSGVTYRRNLPHIREAGKVYHVRFSTHADFGRLRKHSHFRLVQEAIVYGHKKTHLLYGYVIMPDHVHALSQPLPKVPGWSAWCDYRCFYRLEEIFRNVKNFSARTINKTLGRRGSVWLAEGFDRIIRNEGDLSETLQYIHENPIRWGLVIRPEDYPWSSLSTIYSGRAEYDGWFNVSNVAS